MSTSVRERLVAGQGAFALAVAFGAGILVARGACPAPEACLAAFALAVLAGFALTFLNHRFATSAVLLAVAAAGAYDASLSFAAVPDSVARLICPEGPASDGAVLAFRGTALARTRRAATGDKTFYRYVVKISALNISGAFRPAGGKVLADSPDELDYGSRVEGVAFFYLPGAATVPGQFDYRRYLAHNAIDCVARAGFLGAIAPVGASRWHFIPALFARVRRNLIDRLGGLGLDRRGVIPAVLLADRTALSQSDRDSFVRSGTMHLLSISGLHLAIVAGVFLWILARLGAPAAVAALVTLAAATLYAFLVGPQPPVIRSALMLALFCLGIILYRDTRALSVVSTAALIMLVANPRQISDAGFQLSFVAVLGLFYLGAPLGRFLSWAVMRKRFPLRFIARDAAFGFGVSVGAAAAVAPLGIWHFGTVSFIAPFANLLLIPITWVMVVAGFAAAGLSFVNAALASAVALSSSGAETALIWLAHAFASVPVAYASISWPLWAVLAVCAYFVVLSLAVSFGRRVFAVALLGLLAANAVAWGALFTAGRARPAEAVRIEDRRLAAAVVDSGRRVVVFLSRRGDSAAARSMLRPFLLSRGISRIDLLVETAGADARIRDALRESFTVGAVIRQRRFALSSDSPVPLIAGEPDAVSPGDRVALAPDFMLSFHSVAPANFVEPDEPWYEGLVVEAEVSGRRVIVVLDVTDACLTVVRGHVAPRPDALLVLNPPPDTGFLDDVIRSAGWPHDGDVASLP